MMLAAMLLQAANPSAVPVDWSTLAPLPYVEPPEVTPTLASFVAGEIAGGRCPLARPADRHWVVRVDVAALVGADGGVRRAVPRAIACPTVEQYAAGLVLGFARGNLVQRPGAAEMWYRATIVFDWHG